MIDIFDNSVRTAGDYAGVFECDDDCAYFYLYKLDADVGQKVINSIIISTNTIELIEADIVIRWNSDESIVGLLIENQIWAVFDVLNGKKYGEKYKKNTLSIVNSNWENKF